MLAKRTDSWQISAKYYVQIQPTTTLCEKMSTVFPQHFGVGNKYFQRMGTEHV